MPGTAAHQAYVAQKGARLLCVAELALPQGTLYLSEAGFDRYEPRIIPGGMGTVGGGVSLEGTTVPERHLDITVSNAGRRMERLLEGAYDCTRAAVVMRRASPDLASSDWLTRFTGILASWDYNVEAPDTVTLRCRTDDAVLRNSWAPAVAIRKAEWGEGSYAMPDGIDGLYAPFIYGSHNSSGVTGAGFVPMPCVGYTGTTGRYLVSLGRVKTKIGTWKGDKSSISGTMEYVTRGGKVFTTVNYASGITSGLVINGDFDGYEDVGSGAGSLITNPVRQLWHALGLIYSGWQSGSAWPSLSAAPVDADTWATCADWCDRYKLEGSAYIGGTTQQTKAWVVVERWLESFPLFRLVWGPEGTLRMVNLAAMLDWPGYPTAASRRYHAVSDSADRRLRLPQDVNSLARQVSATHLYSAAEGRSYGSLDVQDPSIIERVVANVRMDWSLSRAA